MTIIKIDPFLDNRWDAFIEKHPDSTIFHHSSWARVLQDRYGTSPSYYAVENNRGEIQAIAPFFLIPSPLRGRRLVCLPCSEYCYPLAYDSADTRLLINSLEKEVESRHIAYLEIRGFNGDIHPDTLSLREYPYYINHFTVLSDRAQDLRARLSRDTRYHLNRGEKSAVTIRLAQNEEELKIFHRLTSDMRRRIHLLPWPYRYFQSIYRHLIVPGYAFLLLADMEGQIVSGGIFLGYKDKLINKINASDPRYIQLRTNYLLMWKAIELAYQEKYCFFDFGITDPDNQGLIRFKKHWDSREKILPYYYYPDLRGANSIAKNSLIYKTHTNLNKIMPGFALRLTAEFFYKRLG